MLTGTGRHLWASPALPSVAAPLRAWTAVGERAGPPSVKHGNRLGDALALEARGGEELIHRGAGEELLEGSWSNVWLPRTGGLRTPPADGRILPGVTRELLLEVGSRLGLRVELGPVRLAEARESGLWLSSSLRLLVGVGELDGAALPEAEPRALREALAELLAEAGRAGRQL